MTGRTTYATGDHDITTNASDCCVPSKLIVTLAVSVADQRRELPPCILASVVRVSAHRTRKRMRGHDNGLVLTAHDKVACLVWWTWRRTAGARFRDEKTVALTFINWRREDAVLDTPGRFSRPAESIRRDRITQLLACRGDSIAQVGVRTPREARKQAVVWQSSNGHEYDF